MNPYRGLPDYHFWSLAMTMPAPTDIDPVVYGEFRIAPSDKIATLGSCFAQHVARWIRDSGYSYLVTEQAPEKMSMEEATRRNYGVFSARYANVYTVRQAVQLFDRAFGKFMPYDATWRGKSGFVDPFRPQIEPDEFRTPEATLIAREIHLAAVRRVFLEADVIVFTLGLTEGWQSRRDGAVFPTAPGVAGGVYDSNECGFVNFDVRSVMADLEGFCDRVHEVNHRARIILTISPVPLIATYEKRHVLVSTVASKSILRVAADQVSRLRKHVTYFPSYEIITAPGLSDRYYGPDLREVTPLGVNHVMRTFERHFMTSDGAQAPSVTQSTKQKVQAGVVCDEDAIENAK